MGHRFPHTEIIPTISCPAIDFSSTSSYSHSLDTIILIYPPSTSSQAVPQLTGLYYNIVMTKTKQKALDFGS